MKEVAHLEKRMKNIDDELSNIKVFQQHNSTNFITVLRPVLKSLFPAKYIGKDGNQSLQRDIRYLKVSCAGKIPQDLTMQNVSLLLRKGKSKVSDTIGVEFVSNAVDQDTTPDTSCQPVQYRPGPVEYGNSHGPYMPSLNPCMATPYPYMQQWVYSHPSYDMYRSKC